MYSNKCDELKFLYNKKSSFIKFMIIAMLSMFFVSSNFINAYAEDKINIKVNEGFEGKYKIGYSVPFNIEVENNLKNINGKVQIEIVNRNDERDKLIIYSKDINLPKGTVKNVKMNVPINRQMSQVKVSIIEGKEKIFSDKVKINIGSSEDKYFIGILSDDYDSVNYFNTVEFSSNKQIISTVSVELNENNFPIEIDALNNFNVIVINNFNTSNLSKEQYEILKKWVNNGGTLIIGTGPSHRKTLSIFEDDFLRGTRGELNNIKGVNIKEFTGDTSEEPMILNVLDIKPESAVHVLNEDGKGIIFKINKGDGVIGISAFDLGLNPIANWDLKDRFSRNLLKNIMPIDTYGGNYDKRNLYYDLRSIFRVLPDVPVPNGKLLMIMFIIYILITGPFSYIVLKKKDKREFMWITVPVLAVIFSIGVYFIGFGTRITKPITNVLNFASIDEKGNIGFESYGCLFLPNKMDIKLEAAEEEIIRPIALDEEDRHYGNTTLKAEQLDTVVNLHKNKTSLEYYNNPVFSSKYFAIENNKSLSGAVKCDITYDGAKIIGTITNNSPFDLDEGYIVDGTMYIAIGEIKKGESKKIDEKIEYFNGRIYEFTDKVYGNNSYRRGPFNNYEPDEVKEIKEKRQNRNIIDMRHNSRRDILDKPVLIGFSKNLITDKLLVNSKETDKTEKTFIIQEISLNLKKGDKVELPYGYIKGKVIENNFNDYDEYSKEFFGKGNAVIQYYINDDISVNQIDLKFKDPRMYSTKKIENNSKSPIFIWNAAEAKWEETKSSPVILKEQDLEKYLSEKTLKIKLELKEDKSSYELPKISVKGSVQ